MNEHRDYTYRGHAITVEACEDKPGSWGWSFVIDGRFASKGRDRVFTHRWAALIAGLSAARSRADSMAPVEQERGVKGATERAG